MKNKFLGIDTSNYTSSCAVYDPETDSIDSLIKLLPVSTGQVGLRQSDAVFHHTKNLPPLLSALCERHAEQLCVVSSSFAPRSSEGSYMPCFSVGEGYADVLSASLKLKNYKFSHQAGHVAAAIWSSGQKDLVDKTFLAFHVSGGTTDVLLVKPDVQNVFAIDIIASSLDLKAGQAVDRVGVMLGLDFPAGPELDRLSQKSNRQYSIKPFFKDGSCSFSGLQNKCEDMLKKNEEPSDIAKYCIDYICAAIRVMTQSALMKCGELPIVYAGGVMSNSIINKTLTTEFAGVFCPPEFSSDNAAGTAYLGYIKESRKW
ncbi:MAG: peptidase M22 [Clostridia bacterium]|nr:peptidase M22 [Clostridia bacterium]